MEEVVLSEQEKRQMHEQQLEDRACDCRITVKRVLLAETSALSVLSREK